MKQRYVLALMVCAFVALVFPVNSTYHIKDNYGRVRMSRVDRKSILISYGTYLTPGVYRSLLRKPDSFIKPRYVTAGPFDDGCFDLVAEFIADTIVVYMGTPCASENLNDQFKLAGLPNAFGEKNWI